jgi:hypothetical protein
VVSGAVVSGTEVSGEVILIFIFCVFCREVGGELFYCDDFSKGEL